MSDDSEVRQVADDPARLRDLLDHMLENAGLVGLRLSLEHDVTPEGKLRTVLYMTHSMGRDVEKLALEQAIPVMTECHGQMLLKLSEKPCPAPEPRRTVWGFAGSEWPDTWHTAGDTREEAIDEGRSYYDGKPFWIVQGEYSTADDYATFAAEAAIESMQEQAYNDGGEAAEDYAPSDEARAELDTMIRAWARRRMKPCFWTAVGSAEKVEGEES